ncbi:MAG: CotH kinase family protein [Haliscomenobacter sp.]|nr:CotH kinase family protein [Haliscomenobacter sp.]
MKNVYVLLALFVALSASPLRAQEDPVDLYHMGSIREIKIVFEEDNWRYLLDSLRFNGENLLKAASVEVMGQLFAGAGVRILDSQSFQPGSKRNGLFVQLDYSAPGQQIQGHSSLSLSGSLRDPSMIREVLGLEMARKYMPAPKANYANVWINNERYGLYVNVESVEGDFLVRHFKGTSGNLYYSHPETTKKPLPGCAPNIFGSLQQDRSVDCLKRNFHLIQGASYAPLVEFIRLLNLQGQPLEDILYADQTLWMLAFNNVMGNLSSYSGKDSPKYFLYQDVDGKMAPVLWSLNLAFGGYKNTGIGSDLKVTELQQFDFFLYSGNNAKPLISKLLANAQYRKIYLSHLRTLLYNELANGNYQTRARELQQLIQPSFVLDSNKTYSQIDFEQSLASTIGKVSKIPGVFEFLEGRIKYLKRHPELSIIPPGFSDLKVKSREKFSPALIEDFQVTVRVGEYARKVQLFYRFDPGQPFQSVAMADDGAHEDGQSNDSLFGALIKPQGGARQMEYYIMAENAKTVSYFPERYMFEWHKVTLDELNR